MKCNIIADLNDEKITFKLSIPYINFDIDKDKYYEYDDIAIYECNYSDINYNILNKNFSIIIRNLQKDFSFIDSNYEYISLNDEFINNKKILYSFLKQHKNLKIVLNTNYNKALIENLKDEDFPNLKITFSNSTEKISYKEFYEMNLKLNEIINFVNYYNLSPLEKVMLVYDIVKSKKYKKENIEEDANISRNLNQIVNNDKIVCVGFSNLLDYLLTNLGINSNIISVDYEQMNIGHQRNYIHLKDDKYNIDGIFFLDATWDSKKDINYLDNYHCFLKPLNFFKSIKQNEIVRTPIAFKLLQKNKKELLTYIKNLNSDKIIELSISLVTLINKYENTHIPFFSLSSKSNEEITSIIDKIYAIYDSIIDEQSFKNSLYKIRKIEYINNIIDFVPSEEYIDSVYQKCYPEKPEIKFLKMLGLYDTPSLDKSLKDAKASSTQEDLLRIRFLHAIKTKIKDFPENEFIKKM